jgi:hypothetical protein
MKGPKKMAVYNYDYANWLTVTFQFCAVPLSLFPLALIFELMYTSMQHHVPDELVDSHPISLDLPSIFQPFSYALDYTSTWIVYTRVSLRCSRLRHLTFHSTHFFFTHKFLLTTHKNLSSPHSLLLVTRSIV